MHVDLIIIRAFTFITSVGFICIIRPAAAGGMAIKGVTASVDLQFRLNVLIFGFFIVS